MARGAPAVLSMFVVPYSALQAHWRTKRNRFKRKLD
jgi:hypothetical protein